MKKRVALACSLAAVIVFAAADQWSNVAGPGPSARGGAVMETVQGVLYLHGGFGPGGALGDLWRWTGSGWEQVVPVGATPPPRYLHSGTGDGRYLYVLLGQGAGGEYLSDVWRYDPRDNRWTELTAGGAGSGAAKADVGISVERSRATAQVVSVGQINEVPGAGRNFKSIVALGGATPTSDYSDQVLVYNIPRNEWGDGGTMPYGLADHNTAVLINGDRVVFNGRSSLGVNDQVWRMRLRKTGAEFTQLHYADPRPPISEGAAVFGIRGTAFVSGGWYGQPLNRFWALDCNAAYQSGATCTWGDAGSAMPVVRWEHAFGYYSSFTKGEPVQAVLQGGRDETFNYKSDSLNYEASYPLDNIEVDFALPSMADLTGRGGVKFTSRFLGFNWCDRAINVEATYTPRADLGGSPLTGSFTLSPGVLYETETPFMDWWNIPAGTTSVGSVLFDVDGGDPQCFFAQSIITATNPDGTAYGQFFPALSWDQFVPQGVTVSLPMTEDPTLNRVNAGLMGGFGGTSVTLQPFGSDGTPLAPAEQYDLDQGENLQLNDLFSRWNLDTSVSAYLKFGVSLGAGVAYVSELDGRGDYTGTSDPTSRFPTGWGDRLVFPEIGTVQGLDLFRGGFSLINYGATQADVQASFYERGVPGVAASTSFQIPPGGLRVFPDATNDLFQKQAVGTIQLDAPNGEILGLGREYAVYTGGGGVVVGTAGQRVPGLTEGQQFFPGFEYQYLGLRQTGTGAGSERSHAVFFNPGTVDATATLKLYDGPTGAAEGEMSWTLPAQQLRRFNFVVQELNPAYNSNTKRLEVRISDQPVYGSVYYLNRNGDPVELSAARVP